MDGTIEASTHKFKNDLQGRTSGVTGIIKRHASAECLGVCIEERFSGQFSSVKAFPIVGAAVLACDLEGPPWSTAHIAKLKILATGRGNAKKPEMQASAKARWGLDLKEDEADARWAAAYGLDADLFS